MKKLLLFFLIVLNIQPNISAQSAFKIVIISPRVGEIIDSSEKEYFHLFQSIKGFNQAIFFMDSTDSYFASVYFIDKNRTTVDTVIEYSKPYLIRTSELIDNFEQANSGNYQFVRTEYDFPTINDSNNLLSAVSLPLVTANSYSQTSKISVENKGNYSIGSKDYNLLPLSEQKVDIDLDYYPILGFGIGISTVLTATSDINSTLTSIEDKYRNQGYSIKHNEYQPESSGYLWLCLKVKIIKNISVSLDVASTLGQSPSKMNSIKLFGTYKFDVFELKSQGPYVGVGINYLAVTLSESFSYRDRISPIDTTGRFEYLGNINITGEGSSFGINFTAGLDIYLSSIGIDLYTDYNLMSPITLNSGDNNSKLNLNFSGFTFGAILFIYF